MICKLQKAFCTLYLYTVQCTTVQAPLAGACSATSYYQLQLLVYITCTRPCFISHGWIASRASDLVYPCRLSGPPWRQEFFHQVNIWADTKELHIQVQGEKNCHVLYTTLMKKKTKFSSYIRKLR